jgi:hypothetical protein
MLFRLENVFSELCLIHISFGKLREAKGKWGENQRRNYTRKGTKNSLAYRVIDLSELGK